MQKATRVCKVCGKPYEYCKTWNNTNKFRWQDVACSYECGVKYFQRVEESRMEKADEKAQEAKPSKKKVKKSGAEPSAIID